MAGLRALTPFVFAILAVGSAAGQTPDIPRSAFLEWRNLRMVISPDHDGTYVWVNSGEMTQRRKDEQYFGGTFPPADVLTWASDARWFLDLEFAKSDTGATRSSAALQGRGGRIYLVRRKHDGDWTKERFMVMESPGHEPVIINGVEGDAREIIDSLESIARNTPTAPSGARQSVRELVEQSLDPLIDTPAAASPDNRPPLYPDAERSLHHEGIVLLAFYVGVDGKADMSSLQVVHATSVEFLKSTLVAMPRLRFSPARSKGVPVRQRVVMPFSFQFYR